MSNVQDIPVWEKYTLTIEEASKYFRIGENKFKTIGRGKQGRYLVQMSLVCVMMNTSHIKALSNKERSRHHERKKTG